MHRLVSAFVVLKPHKDRFSCIDAHMFVLIASAISDGSDEPTPCTSLASACSSRIRTEDQILEH